MPRPLVIKDTGSVDVLANGLSAIEWLAVLVACILPYNGSSLIDSPLGDGSSASVLLATSSEIAGFAATSAAL